MNVYVGNRLPSTYQEVEYIESSGTQWINTGVYVNPDYTVEASFIKTQNVSFLTLFGTRDNTLKRFVFRSQSDISAFKCQRCYNTTTSYGEEYNITSGYSDSNQHTIKMNRYVYRDGTLVNTFSATTTSWTSTYTLGIFALHAESDNVYDYGYYKLYYLKIWDSSNNLVRSFIPCYRKSDSVIGLYDLVNNQFYTNSGTGTFSKGSDVVLCELKNAYIGEVWTPGSNTIAYFPLTSSTTTTDSKGTYNLTNAGNVVFGTYQGVSCAYFNGTTTSQLYNTSLSFHASPTQTVSVRMYISGTSSSVYQTIYHIGTTAGTGKLGSWFKYGTGLCLGGWTGSSEVVKSGNINGAWHLLTNVTNGSSSVQYLDGVQYQTLSNSLTGTQTGIYVGLPQNNTNDKLTGYLSNLIVENKARSATEVSDYYNQTKSNYGL